MTVGFPRDVGIEEEPPGLGDDRENDADRGQDGDQRAHEQHDENKALEQIARPEEPIDARQDQRQHAQRQRQAENEDGPSAYRMHARIGVGSVAHSRIDRAAMLARNDVADLAQRDAPFNASAATSAGRAVSALVRASHSVNGVPTA